MTEDGGRWTATLHEGPSVSAGWRRLDMIGGTRNWCCRIHRETRRIELGQVDPPETLTELARMGTELAHLARVAGYAARGLPIFEGPVVFEDGPVETPPKERHLYDGRERRR